MKPVRLLTNTLTLRGSDSASEPVPGTALNPGGAPITATREATRDTGSTIHLLTSAQYLTPRQRERQDAKPTGLIKSSGLRSYRERGAAAGELPPPPTRMVKWTDSGY